MTEEPFFRFLLFIFEVLVILKTSQVFTKLVKRAGILGAVEEQYLSTEFFSENDEQEIDPEEEIVMIPATD